ncbi:hypothetical protein [uncultured Clostridium sp.]|uniref:hypothetical protein n=1 Tax=uncultured Clostridium sp. TaxID=59620 RepID=UPI0028E7C75E|nr:hypothetical protein [uncultured Clostridium sp.]
MAKVNYVNQASFKYQDTNCLSLTQPIYIKSETKVFSYKHVFSEADCNCQKDCYPGKGDDIGFTLIFGNYGEETYTPTGTTGPTVIDTLDLSNIYNASLKVMDLCIGKNFKVFDVTVPGQAKEVIPGQTEFAGGTKYTLEIRECHKNTAGTVETCTSEFCLPCHSVFCVTMLFQVEFSPCSKLKNGGFCDGKNPSLENWIAIPASGGGTVEAVSSYKPSKGGNIKPQDGDCGFALLKTGDADVKSILKQTFKAEAGDKLSFYAFFDLPDSSHKDEAQAILIKSSTGSVIATIATKSAPYVSNNWELQSYTFTECGTITFEATVKNTIDNKIDGHLAIDAVTITHP